MFCFVEGVVVEFDDEAIYPGLVDLDRDEVVLVTGAEIENGFGAMSGGSNAGEAPERLRPPGVII